jgi:DNA-binding transcriptional LysR family regulator
MIKRSQLRQFLAVVDSGNFTRAAQRLNQSQPTLSVGIAGLERQLGASLFLREKRHVRLTEAGSRFLAHARSIEREFRVAEASLSGTPRPSAPIRLGVLASISTEFIARLVRAHDGSPPLILVEGSDSELRARLKDGGLDAALTLVDPVEARGAHTILFEEGYRMMLSRDHPLAGRTELHPEELGSEVMIARRSCEILGETSRYFTQRGVRPIFALRSPNDDRCLAMVAAGLGITTAPESQAREGVVAVKLVDYDYRRAIGLVEGLGPPPQSLIAAARAAAAIPPARP